MKSWPLWLIALLVLSGVVKAIQSNPNWIGSYGEKLTARELRRLSRLGRKGKTLRNAYLPKEDGETSEIDVMYITQKGIFVFESKNYSGWIFGDEDGQYWTAMLPNRQKNRFYNPIKQNRTHLKWLQSFVGENVPLFSIIVFSERCELKKVEVKSNDVKVIKRDLTYATVRSIWDASEDRLTEEEVESLYEELKKLTDVDEATKAAHIQNIKNKTRPLTEQVFEDQEQVEGPKENTDHTAEKICPHCGKPLVLKTARCGENAGKQFYGCSGYPSCRYIEV